MGWAVGMGSRLALAKSNPALSSQVTQLQQVHADWRQRLHGTVAPAVPVCGREGSRAGWEEGGGPAPSGMGGKVLGEGWEEGAGEEPLNAPTVGWAFLPCPCHLTY